MRREVTLYALKRPITEPAYQGVDPDTPEDWLIAHETVVARVNTLRRVDEMPGNALTVPMTVDGAARCTRCGHWHREFGLCLFCGRRPGDEWAPIDFELGEDGAPLTGVRKARAFREAGTANDRVKQHRARRARKEK